MRILLDINPIFEYPFGGIPVYAFHLAQSLAQEPSLALSACFFSFRPNTHKHLRRRISELNHAIRYVGVPLAGRLANMLGAFSRWMVPKDFRKPDLIHGMNFLLPRYLDWSGIPKVLTVHDLAFLDISLEMAGSQKKRARLLAKKLGIAIRKASSVLVPSHHTRSSILRNFDVAPERIFVSPLASRWQNCCSQDVRFSEYDNSATPTLDRYGLAKGSYILYVSQLNPRKNIESLLEAFTKLRKANPDIELIFVGRLGFLGSSYAAQIKQTTGARWIGPVNEDELQAIYRHALFFSLLSHDEGFGIPCLEAMQCGCPVLYANGSAMDEVVGDAGISVEPTDIHGATCAMEQLANDSMLRDHLSQLGLNRSKEFTWERCERKTIEAYEFALSTC